MVDAVKEFSEKHPFLTGIVKWGGAAAAIVTAAVANNHSGGGRSSGDGGSGYSSSDLFDDYSRENGDFGVKNTFNKFPRTNGAIWRIFDINIEQSSHVETVVLMSRVEK